MLKLRHHLAQGAVVFSLVGCGGGDSAETEIQEVPEADRFGGTAVVGMQADIADMNPLTSSDAYASEIQQFVLFLPVIHYDENLQPIPALARSWEVNRDTTLLTFHLRDDVYWHDGVKTTAEDLLFAYEKAIDPETLFPNAAFWTHYGTAAAPDSFTFTVEMRPHAEFMDPWRTFPAVPKHVLGDVPSAAMATHPFNTREPLGNGPFRFVSHLTNQSWTFEANPDFPKELGGRPYLDRIVFRAIPEPSTLLTELITGNIDFLTAPPPQQASNIESAPGVRLVNYMDRTFVFIGWNQRRPFFDDVRVRRALTKGINRDAIVDAVLYGYGQVSNSTVPPFYWQYDESAGADLTFDREAALALFAEAGYTRGADGTLRNAAGEQLGFTLTTNQGRQERADIAAIVQADLAEVGVAVEIQIQEFNTLLDRIQDPESRDFDAVMIGWRTEFRIDDSDLFHCDKIDGLYQYVGMCDPRVDALLDTLPVIADRTAAIPLWQQYQRLIADQQPYTFVYFQERTHGIREWLHNVSPDPRGDWVGLQRWYLDPSAPGRSRNAAAAGSGGAAPPPASY